MKKKIDIKIESNFESIQLIEKTNENNITIDNINKENNKQTSSLISYSKEESKKRIYCLVCFNDLSTFGSCKKHICIYITIP